MQSASLQCLALPQSESRPTTSQWCRAEILKPTVIFDLSNQPRIVTVVEKFSSRSCLFPERRSKRKSVKKKEKKKEERIEHPQ